MARKSGLGKGLEALIPGGTSGLEFQPENAPPGLIYLAVSDILPNPHQPRSHFDKNEMDELAASIKEHGVLQPLLVTRSELPNQYILIAGERRLLAARQAGLDEIPAVIREASELERVELALIENVQRADLSPLETAEAYRQLAEEFNLSHEQIAARVGKSRTAISNTLRLLKLPAAIQQSLAEAQITEGHARALLALPTPQSQLAALQTVVKRELNVRQTEDLVRKLTGQKITSFNQKAKPPELAALESRLRESLGTKVTLNHRHNGGTLVIHYYSDEELNNLVERFLNGE